MECVRCGQKFTQIKWQQMPHKVPKKLSQLKNVKHNPRGSSDMMAHLGHKLCPQGGLHLRLLCFPVHLSGMKRSPRLLPAGRGRAPLTARGVFTQHPLSRVVYPQPAAVSSRPAVNQSCRVEMLGVRYTNVSYWTQGHDGVRLPIAFKISSLQKTPSGSRQPHKRSSVVVV